MPKLTPEVYAERRQHILDAAKLCFARKGFHGSSMTDLMEEANVSAGSIYVYFASKAEIINAITDINLGRLTTALATIIEAKHQPSFADVMLEIVRLDDAIATGPTRGIAFDVWGEGVRQDDIGEVLSKHLANLRELFVRVAERAISTGELPRSANAREVGAVLLSLVIFGYYGQRLTLGGITPESYVDGLLSMLGSD